MPERLQLRRTKGYRKPEGAVYVGRPSKFGNPFPWQGDWIVWAAIGLGYRADPAGRRAAAVALHRAWLTEQPIEGGPQADSDDGGALEFANGDTVSMAEHTRNIAFAAASLFDAPEVPDPPDLTELRGHDLLCWCPLDGPCHADTLLQLANRVPSMSATAGSDA